METGISGFESWGKVITVLSRNSRNVHTVQSVIPIPQLWDRNDTHAGRRL
jgi:hypothetical protein